MESQDFGKYEKSAAQIEHEKYIADMVDTSNPYVIHVENNGIEKRRVTIFGYDQNCHKDNYGNHEDIVIQNGYAGSTYLSALMESSRLQPDIAMIRLISTTEAQVSEWIMVQSLSARGTRMSYPIVSSQFIKEEQYIKTINDIPVDFKIDGLLSLGIDIHANQSLSIFLFLKNVQNNSGNVVGFRKKFMKLCKNILGIK